MSEEIKVPTGQDSESEKDTMIKSLSSQIENLNKGIATYRDEAKNANEVARNASEVAKVAAEKVAEFEGIFKEKNKKDAEDSLSPEDQKKFEAWAKSKGVVTQEELDIQKSQVAQESAKEVATTAVADFLEKYPEYDSDVNWQKVQAEFNLYKAPADITGYKKLLEKIHNDLSGGDDGGKARAKVKAEIKTKEHLSLGGRGSGSSGNEDTDARVDKLQDKYPNLSRAQIEARISEIDTIYKK